MRKKQNQDIFNDFDMGAGVDISLATGGVATVAIAGALGWATEEMLNQVGNIYMIP